jgi:hypothetical protein
MAPREYYEGLPQQSQSSVIQDLGMFHIIMYIVLGPVFIGGLLLLAYAASKYQKGWTHTKAKCPTGTYPPGPFKQSCCEGRQCQVTLDTFPDGRTFALKLQDSDNDLGKSWDVAYDPKKDTSKTLTTLVFSDGARKGMEIACFVVAGLVSIMWCVNVALRHNKSWQDVSGAMETADLASSVASFHYA